MPQSTTAIRRSQAERRDAAERSLVEATLAVISEAGVAAATFDAIGRRAGYSRGLATQHFGSKAGLIDAVVAYLHARQDEDLEIAHIDALDGLEALVAFVRQFGAGFDGSPHLRAYFMLLADAVADVQEARAVFAASHERVKARLADLVRRGQREGRIRADVDAEGTALMAGSLLLGVSMQALVDPDVKVAPVCEGLADVLLRSLAPPSQTEPPRKRRTRA